MRKLVMTDEQYEALRGIVQKAVADTKGWERLCLTPPIRQYGLDRARARLAEVEPALTMVDAAETI